MLFYVICLVFVFFIFIGYKNFLADDNENNRTKRSRQQEEIPTNVNLNEFQKRKAEMILRAKEKYLSKKQS
jgi:hypothetical protein